MYMFSKSCGGYWHFILVNALSKGSKRHKSWASRESKRGKSKGKEDFIFLSYPYLSYLSILSGWIFLSYPAGLYLSILSGWIPYGSLINF